MVEIIDARVIISCPGRKFVTLNETLAAQLPYRPASLPINRLEDGTMFHW